MSKEERRGGGPPLVLIVPFLFLITPALLARLARFRFIRRALRGVVR